MAALFQLVGHTLGHYHIVEQIGAGGMGVVYRAHDEQLERDVALKALPVGSVAEEAARKRFRKEALTLAKLNHPNIATIFEFSSQDDTDYLVTEYIAGLTLDYKLASGALTEKEVISLGLQLAEGLSAAHEHGIVHRDLKPANLRLASDGRLKILDFGLAQLMSRSSEIGMTATQTLTQSQEVTGTLPYMAPEQLRGEPAEARTDIWAAGAVLYEMATGQRPFASKVPTALAADIIHKPPPSPRSVNPDLSSPLEAVILKCLEKDPALRYESAQELRADLERLIAGTAPVATTRRIRWNILACVVAALLLFVVGAVYWSIRRPTVNSLAVLPFANAADPGLEYLSDGITDTVINSVSQIPHLKVISRASTFRYKGQAVDPEVVGRDLRVGAVLIGRVAHQGDILTVNVELVDAADDTHIWGEQYQRAVSSAFAIAEDITRQLPSKLRLKSGTTEEQPTIHSTPNTEAYKLYLQGRYYWNKRTEDGLRKSVHFFQNALDVDPGYSLVYAGLADSYDIMGAYRILAPGDSYPRAKEAAKKALELDPNLAEGHSSLALARASYDWNWGEAEKEYTRAIQLNPNYATAHQWYSLFLLLKARYDEADREMKKAAELDPLSLIIAAESAGPAILTGRYGTAARILEKAQQIDPDFFVIHESFADLYEAKGEPAKAVAELQLANKTSGGSPWASANLAVAYALAGNQLAARNVLDFLQREAQHRYVSAYEIASIYAALGDREKALAALGRSIEERSLYNVGNNIATDPAFKNLLSDPRCANVLQQARPLAP
jgi:eukaryotic-like serine/threonine-protein kinase